MAKIQSVEAVQVAAPAGERSSPWSSTVALVRVTTSTGAIGWGEAPTTLMSRPVVESIREVARFYEGVALEQRDSAYRRFQQYSFYLSRSMEATSALSAVDIACWDLIGRERGLPVARLLGRIRRRRMRAYANGWYADCVDPEEFSQAARAMVARGFSAIKFDPFGDAFLMLSKDAHRDAVERVRAVRASVGPKVDLLIEFHGRFLPAAATRAGRALDAFRPLFMEEPTRPELSDALAAFRRTVKTPVALGERLLTPADFESFLRRGLVDILQPDITNSGGFTGGQEIGLLAARRRAPVAYHNAFGPVQTAATLQLAATLPTFLIQESFEASWPEWKTSLASGYRLEEGYFELPDRPGLGILVDERRVEEFRSDSIEPVGREPPWVVAGTWHRSPDRGPGSRRRAKSR